MDKSERKEFYSVLRKTLEDEIKTSIKGVHEKSS
jgi:hypothetical protein